MSGEAEYRAWMETPAGQLCKALGIDPRADAAETRRAVDQMSDDFEYLYGRQLSPGEKASVRAGLETKPIRVGLDSFDLAQRAGWGCSWDIGAGPKQSTVALRVPVPGRGLAVMVNGRWQGDPDIAAQAEAGMAARQAQLAAQRPPGGMA